MTNRSPILFCVGTNHESAGLDFRETLYLEREDIDIALPKLIAKHSIQEAFVLSTCNRLEIYGVLAHQEIDIMALKQIFIDLQHLAPTQKIELEKEIRNHSYSYKDIESVTHAFSVAAGLDSLVLGETQITGQFKDAVQHAIHTKTLGPILNRMTQEALSAAKKVRSQTDISRKPVSISHAAIDLANRLYGNISEHNVLIIGAGEMSTIAAKYATKYKPKQLFLCNRTLARAQDLAKQLEYGQAFAWDELSELLVEADIIISSTSAHEFIIDKHKLMKAQSKRANRPSFLVDIALPRDIDPACGELDDVYLFDIDDLKQVVGENYEERKKAAEKGRELIDKAAENFTQWVDKLSLKPAMADFRTYLENLFEQEMKKSISKTSLNNLNDIQTQALEKMLASIANKITGDVGRGLKDFDSAIEQSEAIEVLNKFFSTHSNHQGNLNHASKDTSNCHTG